MLHFPFIEAGELALSAFFGALIGYERERHGHPAGLRTHILVGVGATLFTLASLGIAEGRGGDPGRIAAQIVSGIGFLGAGTILRQGSVVKGLTTAASLWVVAGIGMAVGIGGQMLITATVAVIVVLITLNLVRILDDRIDQVRTTRDVRVSVQNCQESFDPILGVMAKEMILVRRTEVVRTDSSAHAIAMRIHRDAGLDTPELTGKLIGIPGVVAVEWE